MPNLTLKTAKRNALSPILLTKDQVLAWARLAHHAGDKMPECIDAPLEVCLKGAELEAAGYRLTSREEVMQLHNALVVSLIEHSVPEALQFMEVLALACMQIPQER